MATQDKGWVAAIVGEITEQASAVSPHSGRSVVVLDDTCVSTREIQTVSPEMASLRIQLAKLTAQKEVRLAALRIAPALAGICLAGCVTLLVGIGGMVALSVGDSKLAVAAFSIAGMSAVRSIIRRRTK